MGTPPLMIVFSTPLLINVFSPERRLLLPLMCSLRLLSLMCSHPRGCHIPPQFVPQCVSVWHVAPRAVPPSVHFIYSGHYYLPRQ